MESGEILARLKERGRGKGGRLILPLSTINQIGGVA